MQVEFVGCTRMQHELMISSTIEIAAPPPPPLFVIPHESASARFNSIPKLPSSKKKVNDKIAQIINHDHFGISIFRVVMFSNAFLAFPPSSSNTTTYFMSSSPLTSIWNWECPRIIIMICQEHQAWDQCKIFPHITDRMYVRSSYLLHSRPFVLAVSSVLYVFLSWLLANFSVLT